MRLAPLFIFILCCQICTSQNIVGELKKWHKVSLIFDGPNTYESAIPNPFADYRLDVQFFKNADSLKVPGYYAGSVNAAETSDTSGNKWIVHFAPPDTGLWFYNVSFRTGTDIAISSDTGTSAGFMDGVFGDFIISPSDKTGRDFRGKGRLEYVGEHYLQFADSKEWFFKGGPDAPENTLAYEDFDDMPNRGGRLKSWSPHQMDYDSADASGYTWQGGKGSELLGVINYLAGKNLNAMSFLTFSLSGDDDNVFPHLLKVPTDTYNAYDNADQWNLGVYKDRFDVSKLAQWERIFEYADKKGMYLHFKTQETENDQRMDGGALDRERKLYYRELIARFSHHLALNWNIGEENTNTTAQRIAFAAYFHNNDPYANNIVIHTYPGQKSAVYTDLLGNLSEYTGASLQTSNATYNELFSDVNTWVLNSRNANKKWVVAVDEPGNASIGVDADPDDIDLVRRKVLWATMLAGGAGVEYYYGYQSGCGDLNCQNHRSRDSKYTEVGHAINFFETYCQDFITKSVELRSITSNTNDYVLADTTDHHYIVYLQNGESTTISLPQKSWQVLWFDPLTGSTVNNQSLSSNELIPPDNGDWVALVSEEACSNQILVIRGGAGTGGFLEGGSDEQLADINNFQTFNGNHGWGEFAELLRDSGFAVQQIIEEPNIPVRLDTMNLSQYGSIVFGSNNADYDSIIVDSIESYIRKGGSALFISDANFGSNWGDAPSSDQSILNRFGWVMNQDRGTYSLDTPDFLVPDHPILSNVIAFDGEGVSPIRLENDAVPGMQSTIIVNAKNTVRRNDNPTGGAGTIETPDSLDAALIIATVDLGRIAGHFDRNTFFNLNGAGTDINRLDNAQYAVNLFQWLTACQNTSQSCGIGDLCDDGDPCTTNDTLDAMCNCLGTFADDDSDGVCDANDICPGFDDHLIGTPCDDGDSTTMNDVYTANCICEGSTNPFFVHFELIDATSDVVLRILSGGDTINLANDGTGLNITAVLNTPVGSVRFGLNGETNTQTENVSPYALYGDNSGNYNESTPPLGVNALIVSAYSGSNASGTLYDIDTLIFVVVQGCPNQGETCDDSDPCTINDALDINCNCTGEFIDTNMNGIADICETACYTTHILADTFPGSSLLEFKAIDNISSSSVIEPGANITLKAGEYIRLLPGFHGKAGAQLSILIEGCTP